MAKLQLGDFENHRRITLSGIHTDDQIDIVRE